MINKALKALAVFLFLHVSLYGQQLEKRIDSLVKSYISDDGSGIAIIVKKEGNILYHKAFGKANVELGVDMQPSHVFRIGSVTKQFTACAILKLAEENKLTLQDDIHKYLPDYPTQNHKITIEHLLTHTSGIKSYTDLPEWTEEVRRKDFEPLDLIKTFQRDELDFPPGEKFKYNNTGYFILGYIIEKASGMSYPDYIKETFFKPLKMMNSYYGSSTQIIPNRASGYQKNADGKLQNANYLSMTQPYSAGSLLSTVEDLAKWNEAVFSYKVVSKESLKKAHTPYKLNNGNETGYGYGWGIGTSLNKKTIQHGGGINGFLTQSTYFPEEDLHIAIFSNCLCFSPAELINPVASFTLGIPLGRKEVKLSVDKLKKLTGEYQLSPTFSINITLEENQLMAQATGQQKIPVFAEAELLFFLKVVDAQLEFIEEGKKITGLYLHQGGMKQKANKIK